MDAIISGAFAQWGTFGFLIIFAIYIIVDRFTNIFKSKNKEEKVVKVEQPEVHRETFGELMATMITGLSDKIDRIDDKVDRLEINSNNINNRLTVVETKLNSQPQAFINQINKAQKEKEREHNKMMEDQMKLGPELHKILAQYKEKMNAHHIFLGSFHNGTTNISGIPYCKFDLIAERFSPDEVERDIEYAFIYKDADILRHDKLPITVLNEGMVHYVINPDGTSKLSEIDDVIYRRMIILFIKSFALSIT